MPRIGDVYETAQVDGDGARDPIIGRERGPRKPGQRRSDERIEDEALAGGGAGDSGERRQNAEQSNHENPRARTRMSHGIPPGTERRANATAVAPGIGGSTQ